MPLICHTGLHEHIYYHYEKKQSFPYGGSFNDVVDVEELIWHKLELTVAWNRVVAVVVPDIGLSGVLWLCFLGVEIVCVPS